MRINKFIKLDSLTQNLKKVSVVVVVLLLIIAFQNCQFQINSVPPKPGADTVIKNSPQGQSGSEFVTVVNGTFMLNGSPFYFAGTNAYYLHAYEKFNPTYVTNTLDMFKANNIKVVRMWGFRNGDGTASDCATPNNDPIIQSKPTFNADGSITPRYSETALVLLDKVIKKAKDRDLKLIIALSNYWGELGGICQYNRWVGNSGTSHPTADEAMFYFTNVTVQKLFKIYVSMLLNRVNTQTGVVYKDEPAIMAFEAMNEPRIPAADPMILKNWHQSMAQYIKSIDSKHLVTTGEEGFDVGCPSVYSTTYSNKYFCRANAGTSYLLNVQIPEIDFVVAHLYPDSYGFNSLVDATHDYYKTDSIQYITDHYNIAKTYNKPFVLEEYGLGTGIGGTPDDVNKTNWYTSWWEAIKQMGVNGSLAWEFTTGSKCGESGGDICREKDPNLTLKLNNFATFMMSK